MTIGRTSSTPTETFYYPFGMPMEQTSANDPYKYGAKEFDQKHGLDQHDFHARTYDQALIRFTSMDPLAEKYYSWSPYVYCINNPISRIDPDGRDDYRLNEEGNIHFVKATKADNHTIYATNDKFFFVFKYLIADRISDEDISLFFEKKGDSKKFEEVMRLSNIYPMIIENPMWYYKYSKDKFFFIKSVNVDFLNKIK